MTSIGQIRRRLQKVEEKVAPEETVIFTVETYEGNYYSFMARDPKAPHGLGRYIRSLTEEEAIKMNPSIKPFDQEGHMQVNGDSAMTLATIVQKPS